MAVMNELSKWSSLESSCLTQSVIVSQFAVASMLSANSNYLKLLRGLHLTLSFWLNAIMTRCEWSCCPVPVHTLTEEKIILLEIQLNPIQFIHMKRIESKESNSIINILFTFLNTCTRSQ